MDGLMYEGQNVFTRSQVADRLGYSRRYVSKLIQYGLGKVDEDRPDKMKNPPELEEGEDCIRLNNQALITESGLEKMQEYAKSKRN